MKAKSEWMESVCEEIEDLNRRDQSRMYSKVEEITGRKSCYKRNIAIENSASTIAMEVEEVNVMCSEYIGELFCDDRPDEFNLEFNDEGQVILHREVTAAMESMKKGKY